MNTSAQPIAALLLAVASCSTSNAQVSIDQQIQQLIRNGRFSQAIDLCERELQSMPSAPIHCLKAEALLNLPGNRSDDPVPQQALVELEAAQALDPENPHLHLLLGRCHFLQRDYVLAAEQFHLALEAEEPRAELPLVHALLLTGDYDRATARIQHALATTSPTSQRTDLFLYLDSICNILLSRHEQAANSLQVLESTYSSRSQLFSARCRSLYALCDAERLQRSIDPQLANPLPVEIVTPSFLAVLLHVGLIRHDQAEAAARARLRYWTARGHRGGRRSLRERQLLNLFLSDDSPNPPTIPPHDSNLAVEAAIIRKAIGQDRRTWTEVWEAVAPELDLDARVGFLPDSALDSSLIVLALARAAEEH